jgi:hypothetical protein
MPNSCYVTSVQQRVLYEYGAERLDCGYMSDGYEARGANTKECTELYDVWGSTMQARTTTYRPIDLHGGMLNQGGEGSTLRLHTTRPVDNSQWQSNETQVQ